MPGEVLASMVLISVMTDTPLGSCSGKSLGFGSERQPGFESQFFHFLPGCVTLSKFDLLVGVLYDNHTTWPCAVWTPSILSAASRLVFG